MVTAHGGWETRRTWKNPALHTSQLVLQARHRSDHVRRKTLHPLQLRHGQCPVTTPAQVSVLALHASPPRALDGFHLAAVARDVDVLHASTAYPRAPVAVVLLVFLVVVLFAFFEGESAHVHF